MAEVIRPLHAREIVAPLLPSLPGAAIASEPATAVLPLLTPILRQRVQFLSASSSEPWIRLLSYDSSKAARLIEIARSTRLEPHPLSGEIEIDWDSTNGDVELRYKRLDVETLQALVFLRDLDLVFRLVYCESDQEGGGSGWRVGEVSIPDKPHVFSAFGGFATVSEAEQAFVDAKAKKGQANGVSHHHTLNHSAAAENEEEDDDDDDYWARYDATPARTPAVKRSPAPGAGSTHSHHHHHNHQTHLNTHLNTQSAEAEDAYFAQYDSVQPAMDNHDPDEVVEAPVAASVAASVAPPLGLGHLTAAQTLERSVNGINVDGHGHSVVDHQLERDRFESMLHHPRPASASSNSSSGASAAVAKLEESAGKREQNEFGVKQHVSRSIKSLFMLARASGIDREEFEQLVKTELDMLALMED